MWIVVIVIFIFIAIAGSIGLIKRDYFVKIWKSMKHKPFGKGDTVFISDLILSPQYNNLIGVIASDLDKKKKRFAVKLMYYQEKYITVKPENLSFVTNQKHIESILRHLGINQRCKYITHSSHDFIQTISTKYKSSSLPPLHKLFNGSFKNYQENADSVHCVIQYLSLFSSVSSYRYFSDSFWANNIDKYSASNKLKTFAQITNHHSNSNGVRNENMLSILFLELFNHKMCIIKFRNEEFRVVQSMSDICTYSLRQELNARHWLNAREMEDFCDALIDVIYGKQLNRSKWLFGDGMNESYFNENPSLEVCVMDDLNVEMFIQSATKILKYITKFELDPITINIT